MKPASIIIVEKNYELRNTLCHAFEDRGYVTWACPGPDIAMGLFPAVKPHIVLLDLDFEGSRSLEILDACKKRAPKARVIVESHNADAQHMRDAIDHGAHAFLIKPYTLEPLFDLLEKDIPLSNSQAA